MTDAQLAVVASLAGVLLGIAGTLITTFLQQRAENTRARQQLNEDRRKDHAELVAAFSAAEMRKWNMAMLLHSWWKAYNTDPGSFTRDKRLKMDELSTEAAPLLDDLMERFALIRILVPALADTASDLVDKTTAVTGAGEWSDLSAARNAAQAKFEEQARTVLDR